MRKVIYSEYQWSPERNTNVLVEVGEAKFHQFGIDYEEFESGPASFSTAIIELEDGKVLNISVNQIRFVV